MKEVGIMIVILIKLIKKLIAIFMRRSNEMWSQNENPKFTPRRKDLQDGF